MFLNRTYKYKLVPNKKQHMILNQWIGSCRYVYNLLLHFNIEQYKKNKKTIIVPDMLKMLSMLQMKASFLKEVPIQILESTIIKLKSDLNASLKKNGHFPPFRKRGKDDFFSLIKDFSIQDKYIILPDLSPIKFYNSRITEEETIKTIHISKKRNQWFLSILISKNTTMRKIENPKFVGIDVGIKEFAILSSGFSMPNPEFYRKLEDKLIFEQKKLTRKVHQSNGWYKQKERVQKIHDKIYHSRMNFLHKFSTYLVTNFDVIGIETLNIRAMVQNKRLSKSILDAGWGTFIELLKYKAKEKSKHVIEVGRFYPSSQICSNCGSKQFMPLHLRTYCCKECNQEIDRDYNAAKNIEKKAKELYKSKTK